MRACRLMLGRMMMLGLLVPGLALAEAASDAMPAQPLFTVHDLMFKVVDIGGAVRDLEVKESALEAKIELADDVLFDFDKADLKPEAEKTLGEAAAIIRDKTKGDI